MAGAQGKGVKWGSTESDYSPFDEEVLPFQMYLFLNSDLYYQ